MSNKFRTIGVALLILLGLLTLKQVMIVREDEYRVIRSFSGEVNRIITVAGPAMKMPFVESDYSLPKKKRDYDGKPNDILTADQKPIIVDHYTVWQITDPKLFIQNTRTVANAEQRIDAAVYSIVRSEMGKQQYSDIISEGASSRSDLGQLITKAVNEALSEKVIGADGKETLSPKFGIIVYDVRLKKIDLPEQNLQSIYKRMESDRAKVAAQYLSEGDEESVKIRASTDREAQEIMAMATKKAKEIEAEGEKEAASIYNNAYGANPQFYELYRTLESYKITLKGKTAIVLPIDSPYAKILLGR